MGGGEKEKGKGKKLHLTKNQLKELKELWKIVTGTSLEKVHSICTKCYSSMASLKDLKFTEPCAFCSKRLKFPKDKEFKEDREKNRENSKDAHGGASTSKKGGRNR